jgi:putative flavoprotein involved in K+ transport
MHNPDAIIVGGGQAGLAMSRSLSLRGIDHLVLERGGIGERWRAERRASLTLLTTNADSALPGLPQVGDAYAFSPASAFADYLDRYADAIQVPAICGVEVGKVAPGPCGYRVTTNAGEWTTNAVIVAIGYCQIPHRPAMAAALGPSVLQIAPRDYARPDELPDGGVLVVGASATGVQMAEEIQASGRPVTLAIGAHTRMPRRHRGRDIYAWMEASGILDERPKPGTEEKPPSPSLQLVGSAECRDISLEILQKQGVRLLGRLSAIRCASADFDDGLGQCTADSHARMLRTLDRIDAWIATKGIAAPPADPRTRAPFIAVSNPVSLDLDRAGIRSVVWATGYSRAYPWLHVPVLTERGEIHNRGGITPAPGLFVLGLEFMRRRRSQFISGCGIDADEVAGHVRSYLDQVARKVA